MKGRIQTHLRGQLGSTVFGDTLIWRDMSMKTRLGTSVRTGIVSLRSLHLCPLWTPSYQFHGQRGRTVVSHATSEARRDILDWATRSTALTSANAARSRCHVTVGGIGGRTHHPTWTSTMKTMMATMMTMTVMTAADLILALLM